MTILTSAQITDLQNDITVLEADIAAMPAKLADMQARLQALKDELAFRRHFGFRKHFRRNLASRIDYLQPSGHFIDFSQDPRFNIVW